MPHKYEAKIMVNSIRTIENVVADDAVKVKKLIMMKYPGAKIVWLTQPKRIDWFIADFSEIFWFNNQVFIYIYFLLWYYNKAFKRMAL